MMRPILENWRDYQKSCEKLSDSGYITGILGVSVPLNESYPYSPALTEEILTEHMLYENFIKSLLGTAKKAAGKVKDFSVTFYKILQDKKAMKSFLLLLQTKIINPVVKKLHTVFNKLSQVSVGGLNTVVERISEGFFKMLDSFKQMSSGWKKAMVGSSLAILVKWMYDQTGELIITILEKPLEELTGPFVSEIKTKLLDLLNDHFGIGLIKNTLAKVVDIKTYLGWIGPIVDGVGVVTDALAPVTSRMSSVGL